MGNFNELAKSLFVMPHIYEYFSPWGLMGIFSVYVLIYILARKLFPPVAPMQISKRIFELFLVFLVSICTFALFQYFVDFANSLWEEKAKLDAQEQAEVTIKNNGEWCSWKPRNFDEISTTGDIQCKDGYIEYSFNRFISKESKFYFQCLSFEGTYACIDKVWFERPE